MESILSEVEGLNANSAEGLCQVWGGVVGCGATGWRGETLCCGTL